MTDRAHDAHASNAATRREQMFADYDELIALGYSPLTACEHLDIKAANLMRTAYRWGRVDIATPLAAYVAQDRRSKR